MADPQTPTERIALLRDEVHRFGRIARPEYDELFAYIDAQAQQIAALTERAEAADARLAALKDGLAKLPRYEALSSAWPTKLYTSVRVDELDALLHGTKEP